jgi:hypothetical protein
MLLFRINTYIVIFFSQSSYEDQSEVSSYQSPLYDSLSVPKARSDSKTPSTVNNPSQDPKKAYTAHLMKELNISSDVVDRSDTSLYMGYKKYKAIVAATHAASEITWEVRKPTDTEIIEIFVAKSSYHKNLKHFKHVASYPDMQKWLENNDDSPSSLKVWGVHQESYTYANLEEWVLNRGTLDVGGKKKEKGKGKQMLQETEKDEGGSSNLKGKKHKKNKKL